MGLGSLAHEHADSIRVPPDQYKRRGVLRTDVWVPRAVVLKDEGIDVYHSLAPAGGEGQGEGELSPQLLLHRIMMRSCRCLRVRKICGFVTIAPSPRPSPPPGAREVFSLSPPGGEGQGEGAVSPLSHC